MTLLVVLSGLPASGKSTLARLLAARLGAAWLRIDTIEQALRDLGLSPVRDEGYRLAYRVAADNLRLGLAVVADSCNPVEVTRSAWAQVAREAGRPWVDIEVLCSDPEEHRRRVEGRSPEVAGLRLPTWQDVVARDYQAWTTPHLTVDTAGRSAQACADELLERLHAAL